VFKETRSVVIGGEPDEEKRRTARNSLSYSREQIEPRIWNPELVFHK
jgi:hypothetical protein